jgi:monoamine oxidase
MPLSTTTALIVGGGLAGLYVAHLLQRQGRDHLLLEARPTWGGRIAPAVFDDDKHPYAFDLGPTWYWPDFQPQLAQLVEALGLQAFAQHETGDTLIERSPTAPAARVRGYPSSPPSMRIVGGMTALVEAVRSTCDLDRLLTCQTVRHLRLEEGHIEAEALDAAGQTTVYRAQQVLLALPPRLAVNRMAFTPALPQALVQAWQHTPTWMAPHAKYLAVYDTPFWREQGLSGEARSAIGPLAEIHDASAPYGPFALFGFLGLPAAVRRRTADETLKAHCRAQLARLFGPMADSPRAEFLKDWAQDLQTATPADAVAAAHHSAAPPTTASTGVWQHRLIGVASEWSPNFPGYLAGAIEAATLGVQALSRAHQTSP